MTNWKTIMLSSAGGGAEDGWFTRYGDPTQNTGGYNYFGGMSVENYTSDMPNGMNIHLDEDRDTLWAGLSTRYFSDNNGSPSGQFTHGLGAFNATDGSWDSYAATQTWGGYQYNDGYAFNAITSNRLACHFNNAEFLGYFNMANRNWEANATEFSNASRAITYAAPVKVGNSYVGISAKNYASNGYVGYYDSNLKPTGSRKYSNSLSNSSGQWPQTTLAGTSLTNWFSLGRDAANGFDNFILLKWSYNNLQSGKWIQSFSSTTGMNMYSQSMVADSSHVYVIYRSNSSLTNWIFKFDHSLNIVKQVKWSDTISTDSYHGFNQAQIGNDGNIHLFQTGSWGADNRPFSRLIIDKDLTSISDYITVNHRPQGTNNSNNTNGAGSYGVVLDSRDNAYFSGMGKFSDPTYYFGGQGTIGWYLTLMKLPYGFSSTGTYDTSGSGNATYWGNNELIINKPTIPTLTTVSNYTYSSYSNLNLANQNTLTQYFYSNLAFTRDSTRLVNYSFDRENFSIT